MTFCFWWAAYWRTIVCVKNLFRIFMRSFLEFSLQVTAHGSNQRRICFLARLSRSSLIIEPHLSPLTRFYPSPTFSTQTFEDCLTTYCSSQIFIISTWFVSSISSVRPVALPQNQFKHFFEGNHYSELPKTRRKEVMSQRPPSRAEVSSV